ncbi:MAG: hypothetical protein ACNYPE_13740 [Candidatus Azotimanducaceae bacterium WSBS_2022_MAG_OTU7]
MRNFFIALGLVTFLSGCVSSRIEQSRDASTGIASGEAIVLLGRASYNEKQTEESFTECLADALGQGGNPIRLIHQNQFRDELYPWFEPRTAPTSADELGRLFTQPGVKARIDSANIRYLAWIDGDTITVDSGGSMSCAVSTFGGGCFGMSYWEEDASYRASIWDLKTMTSTGQISAEASGTSYLAGVIIPIPILARPGNAACKGLADQLREFIVGET